MGRRSYTRERFLKGEKGEGGEGRGGAGHGFLTAWEFLGRLEAVWLQECDVVHAEGLRRSRS